MKKRLVLIYIIMATMLLAACRGNAREKGIKVDKKEVAPETLSKVAEEIDQLLTSVDSIVEIDRLDYSEFQAMKSEEEKKKQSKMEKQGQENQGSQGQEGQGGGQNQSQQGQGEKSQEKAQEDKMTKDEELFLKWREVDKKIEDINTSWNQYEVESMEKGVNQQKGEELKENLNAFTIAVKNREIRDIYEAGSRVYKSLAPYFDLYKDEISGDLSRVKYSAYAAYLQAEEGNFEEAEKYLKETEEYTSRIRKSLKEDKVKDLEKLSLSIGDMVLALKENNMELLKIKLDIVIENIKALKE